VRLSHGVILESDWVLEASESETFDLIELPARFNPFIQSVMAWFVH